MINKSIFSILINICKNYIPKEDLEFINYMNAIPPMYILKTKDGIQINQMNKISIENSSYLSILDDMAQTLDYLFAIEIVNDFENLPQVINRIGASIKPEGIFTFTYERAGNRKSFVLSIPKRDASLSPPIKDGVIQKLLIKNDFYIQHELDYQINAQEENYIVLIVAQKKKTITSHN